MDAEYIIQQAKYMTEKMYIDAVAEDRQAFHIGLLESRIKELCYILENANDEIQRLQKQLTNKDEL
jgi:hypothetical protein